MKKHLLVVIALVSLLGFKPEVNAQTGYNAVLEYCTGTWCQWCPCGHTNIEGILTNYPNTMVLAYHGAGSDPWQSYSAGIRAIFGFNSYPTGVVSRQSGIIGRDGWNNRVVIQSNTIQPSVELTMNNLTYNDSSRVVSGLIYATAMDTLNGDYYINIILTEDNLIYPQSGNGSCQGGQNYVHNHVVKGMINGDLGTSLNSNSIWFEGDSISTILEYEIPQGFVADNCKINVFVYKQGGSISTDSYVQQSKIFSMPPPIGIINLSEIASDFTLSQNYPNPFNPTTNINFSIPKDQDVSLKFYNSIGQEIATYVNGFLKAGVYNAEFDGRDLSSGIYFYTLKTSKFTETKKMMLVK